MIASSLDWRPAPIRTPGAAADATRMDTVELLVGDLDAQTAFYRDAVTLEVLDQSGARATLGRHGVPIVTLTHMPGLPPVDRNAAGLYHTAIAFPDRTALAAAVLSMAQHAGHLYQGATDHTFSNAFYFSDPEGNGIELYWDRPVSVWQNQPAGWMPTNTAIDPNAFLRAHLDPERTASTAATVGHVHLQVGDIPAARRFYVDLLGFDVVFDVGSALFISAGGYHHHIGLNTWHSAGAGPRAVSLGLGDVRLRMPERDDILSLADRARHHGVSVEDDGSALRLRDPWGTLLTVAPEADGA
jgi:catechol 2,3-dioxygenase